MVDKNASKTFEIAVASFTHLFRICAAKKDPESTKEFVETNGKFQVDSINPLTVARTLLLVSCGTNIIVGQLWQESYCWLAVAQNALLLGCGTDIIVGWLWHETYCPAKQLTNQPRITIYLSKMTQM